MERQIDGRMDRWKDELTNTLTDRHAVMPTDGPKDAQTDRWMYRLTDRWMFILTEPNKLIDRNKHRWVYRCTY
jgi:hypothetical protein